MNIHLACHPSGLPAYCCGSAVGVVFLFDLCLNDWCIGLQGRLVDRYRHVADRCVHAAIFFSCLGESLKVLHGLSKAGSEA